MSENNRILAAINAWTPKERKEKKKQKKWLINFYPVCFFNLLSYSGKPPW